MLREWCRLPGERCLQGTEEPVSSGDVRHQSPEGTQRYDEAQSRKHVISGSWRIGARGQRADRRLLFSVFTHPEILH